MKTILVPIDFSDATERVVSEAATLARALGAGLVLLHVSEPVVGIIDFAVVAMSVARVDDVAHQAAARRLAEIEATWRAPDLDVQTMHAIGSPAAEIVAQAHALSADLIVLGSHGHTALHDLVAGSTATSVLKRAPCPLVVIPPGALRTRDATARARARTPT